MASCVLDHLVVAAATLEEGRQYVRERLGVEIPMGGCHPLMGTHNRLMRLGRDSFLEVIAVDPDAPSPLRARWYALDDERLRAELSAGPRLIAWVLRTDEIQTVALASGLPLGEIIAVTRDALSWQLTVPVDGRLPGGGAFPHLIQWDDDAQPWERMANLGCSLVELRITTPEPDRLRDALQCLCGERAASIKVEEGGEPRLFARILTSAGSVEL